MLNYCIPCYNCFVLGWHLVTKGCVTKRSHGTVIFISVDTVQTHWSGGFKVGMGLPLGKCRDYLTSDIDI